MIHVSQQIIDEFADLLVELAISQQEREFRERQAVPPEKLSQKPAATSAKLRRARKAER